MSFLSLVKKPKKQKQLREKHPFFKSSQSLVLLPVFTHCNPVTWAFVHYSTNKFTKPVGPPRDHIRLPKCALFRDELLYRCSKHWIWRIVNSEIADQVFSVLEALRARDSPYLLIITLGVSKIRQQTSWHYLHFKKWGRVKQVRK